MLNQILRSSQNPEKLSLMIKGMLLGLVPIAAVIAREAGLEGVNAGYITSLIENVSLFVQQAFALISLGMIIWGAVRKPFANVSD